MAQRRSTLFASALLAGLAFGVPGPGLADNVLDAVAGPEPLSTLVKFEGKDYEVTYDSSVSLEPISRASVRKIGYGNSQEINVATTATGTYSTDGLVSPHVLYPGIAVERVFPEIDEVHHHHHGHWHSGPSTLVLSRSASGAAAVSHITSVGRRTCVASRSVITCAGEH